MALLLSVTLIRAKNIATTNKSLAVTFFHDSWSLGRHECRQFLDFRILCSVRAWHGGVAKLVG